MTDHVGAEPLARDRPFFIVGTGRSGTTLLARILSSHSRMAVTPETHYLKRVAAETTSAGEAPPDLGVFWKRYTAWHRFADLAVDPERCRSLAREFGDESFRSLFAGLLAAYGERVGKPRVGEKTPPHVRHIDRIFDWFPEARVIVMVRDPRAVVASQLGTPWSEISRPSLRKGFVVDSRMATIAHWAVNWREVHEITRGWATSDRVAVQSYEELVHAPHEAVERICDFLDEPFEPEMIEPRDVEVPPGTAQIKSESWRKWREEHHKQAGRSISTGAVDKWRDHLTDWEVILAEAICAKGMGEAGYGLTSSRFERSVASAVAASVPGVQRLERAARAQLRRLLN